MAGPTAGYLLGFLLSAVAVGWLAERGWGRDVWRTAATMALGHVVLFIPGWFGSPCCSDGPRRSPPGVTPFITATVLKTGLGVGIVAAVYGLVQRRRQAGG